MGKIKKKPILLFVIAIVALYAIIYIIPSVTGALISSYTAEYGELKVSDETTGYIVRNETVYLASSGGEINRYIEEGSLVRQGTSVMEINGGSGEEISSEYTDLLTRLGDAAVTSQDYTVGEGGVVSYYADGYESRLNPDNMEKGGYSYYSKLSQDNVTDLKRDSAAAGEPVYKVVDRTKWYIVCFVEKEHGDRYEKGRQVTVEFDDDFVETEVYSAEEQDGRVRVILETDYYYSQFAQRRVADVQLVTYDEQGLLVENSSIVEKDGKQGVYVKNKTGEYTFMAVKVYATDGERSLIADDFFYDDEGEMTDTVEIYDEVLKNPD